MPSLINNCIDGLAWIEAGAGATVICLHGMPGASGSWRPQIEALAPSYRVLAWDMPGYGSSTALNDVKTPAGIARVLRSALKERTQSERCHIVGLSLGGMIGMELALAAPDLVASLTLLDTSPKFGLDGTSDGQEFVTSVRQALQPPATIRDFSETTLRELMSPKVSEDAFDIALAAMSTATADGLINAATMITNHDALPRLGQINAPTLVLTGADDFATPPDYGRTIAEKIPGARFVEIEGAGHLSNLERPEIVNKHLSVFLAECINS